jgi:plasmid maintenance system antidote protein VapI
MDHPSQLLRDALASAFMTQAELARRSGLSSKLINQIAQDKAKITHQTALLLERVLGVPAQRWNAAEAHRTTEQLRQAGPALSEEDFQRRVMDYAQVRGWRQVHFRPARQGDKWVTAVTGDPGCPDLILARAGQVLLVELKSATGRLRPGQPEWLAAAGPHGRLWRPADWPTILEDLR